MLLVSFKEFDCDQIFMEALRNINVSEKLNVFRLVQLPFRSVWSCMEMIWEADCSLCSLDTRDLGICTFGDLHKEKGLTANPQGYWGTTVMSALGFPSPLSPLTHLPSIFLPSLSPTPPLSRPTQLVLDLIAVDGVKEQSRQ